MAVYVHGVLRSGKWDGNGDPPALTTCSSSKHLDYDAVKEHQKVG